MDREPDVMGCRVEDLSQLVRQPVPECARDVAGILLVNECLRAHCVDIVDRGRERLVVDVEQIDGIFGDVTVGRDDERDWITDEPCFVGSERRSGRVRDVLAHRRVPLLVHSRIEVSWQ